MCNVAQTNVNNALRSFPVLTVFCLNGREGAKSRGGVELEKKSCPLLQLSLRLKQRSALCLSLDDHNLSVKAHWHLGFVAKKSCIFYGHDRLCNTRNSLFFFSFTDRVHLFFRKNVCFFLFVFWQWEKYKISIHMWSPLKLTLAALKNGCRSILNLRYMTEINGKSLWFWS